MVSDVAANPASKASDVGGVAGLLLFLQNTALSSAHAGFHQHTCARQTAEDLPRTGEGRCNEDIGAVPHTTPVYTDPYGKTHGGVSHMRYLPVFRIETGTKLYELEGKKKQWLNMGDTIQLRLGERVGMRTAR